MATVDVTREQVKAWLKLPSAPHADDALIDQCAAAAGSVASRYADGLPAGDAHLAGVMLGARLYRRRNSPEGVQAMSDGTAVYVARTDPDIARLLRIDGYTTPQVG
ncbi:MAG: hypothetical protein QM708_07230 [Propioniciclava sp.]|uniref:hypothetical protein n=1 Tax=Propioniciclava sp. TaxID=2038686 RepID=UPI0039E3512C